MSTKRNRGHIGTNTSNQSAASKAPLANDPGATNVPAQMVQTEEAADYILSPAPVQQKPETAGDKIARCLFAYCAGIEGNGERVID